MGAVRVAAIVLERRFEAPNLRVICSTHSVICSFQYAVGNAQYVRKSMIYAKCRNIYIYIYIIYIYIYATPHLLSTRLGLLNRSFGVENLGLDMCMDESLSHRYLSLAASHGAGLADGRSQIQQSYSYPSSVKKPTSQSWANVLAMATGSKISAVALGSTRIITPAQVKARGLVMAIVIVQAKFMPQSES